MPELPEVETTRLALERNLTGSRILNLRVFQPKLRYYIPKELPALLENKKIKRIGRRAKYILMDFESGRVLIHLGMSGSLQLSQKTMQDGVRCPLPRNKHDHVEIDFGDKILRYHDPRRFGFWLWEGKTLAKEKSRLYGLGQEPLEKEFSAKALLQMAAGRTTALKAFLMNGRFVVGVGNIYASEALWLARISPFKSAGDLTPDEAKRLVNSIKQVLKKALRYGGTSMRDYVTAEGFPGYFAVKLKVYGKEGSPCSACGTPIAKKILAQRSTFYCAQCQK